MILGEQMLHFLFPLKLCHQTLQFWRYLQSQPPFICQFDTYIFFLTKAVGDFLVLFYLQMMSNLHWRGFANSKLLGECSVCTVLLRKLHPQDVVSQAFPNHVVSLNRIKLTQWIKNISKWTGFCGNTLLSTSELIVLKYFHGGVASTWSLVGQSPTHSQWNH